MQIIGFNFTQISAKKEKQQSSGRINSNIEFLNIEKDNVSLLKDSEALRIDFQYNLGYEGKDSKKTDSAGKVFFEGNLILSTTKDENKEIMKHWKKKEISPNIKLPLFNLIMKKCAAKSLQLQDDIGLPSHIPIPKLQAKQNNQA